MPNGLDPTLISTSCRRHLTYELPNMQALTVPRITRDSSQAFQATDHSVLAHTNVVKATKSLADSGRVGGADCLVLLGLLVLFADLFEIHCCRERS